jgi:hypothetical protein
MLPCVGALVGLLTWSNALAAASVAVTTGCLVAGGKSLHEMRKHNAEAKAAEHWNKNSCNMVVATSFGGSKFHGYSYEAIGDGINCDDLPTKPFIERQAKSCVRKYRRDHIDFGCCEKTFEKAHWKIRISKDEKRHPVSKVHC